MTTNIFTVCVSIFLSLFHFFLFVGVTMTFFPTVAERNVFFLIFFFILFFSYSFFHFLKWCLYICIRMNTHAPITNTYWLDCVCCLYVNVCWFHSRRTKPSAIWLIMESNSEWIYFDTCVIPSRSESLRTKTMRNTYANWAKKN